MADPTPNIDQKAYEKGKRTVCVDLDGVIAEYTQWRGIDHFGPPIKGAREFLQELSKHADEVIIFTTRCNVDVNGKDLKFSRDEPFNPLGSLADRVHRYLYDHNLPYSSVYVGQGKPLAAAYIDDRAISCRPQDPGAMFSDRTYAAVISQTLRLIGDCK